MVTTAWVGVLASVALVTRAQEACAAHDETCLLQVSSSLAVKRGIAMPPHDENALLDSAWSGSYGRSNTTAAEGQCPFGNKEGYGKITIGVIYNRKETVNKAIAKKLGGKATGWFVKTVGKAARSGALAKKMGADYSDINKLIIEQAGPMIVSGIAGSHITVVEGRTSGCDPHEGGAPCPPKHGAVLLEFIVCGPSEEQQELFQCCNVFGGETAKESWRVTGWARGVGDWLFKYGQAVNKTIANYRGVDEHKGIVGGKIFDGLTNALPGQLMAGLEAADVGQPNIVVWPTGLEDGMFQKLALAEQAKIEDPEPDCPSKEMCKQYLPERDRL